MIGDNIKKIRRERGLSQKELGLLVNISQPRIADFENNRRKPNTRMVFALANVLRITVIEIDPDIDIAFLARRLQK